MITFLTVTKFVMLFAAGLFVAALIAALIWNYGKYVVHLISPPAMVQFQSIKTSDDVDMSVYLLARVRELSQGVSLDALYEIKVPAVGTIFSPTGRFAIPDSAKFEIQGVDVPGIVRTVLKIFPDAGYSVTLEPVKSVAGAVARLEWRSPGAEPRVWLVRLDPIANESAESIKRRTLDRAIYTVLHYMFYDPDGPKEWRQTIKLGSALDLNFPTARALEAYYAGVQYLRAYLTSIGPDPENLKSAERELQRLQREMPEFVPGLMLLGTTLSEQRNEIAAISHYERAEELLKKPAMTDIAVKKIWIQARLFKANSYRKLYRWRSVHKAISELEALDREIQATIDDPKSSAVEKFEFHNIRVAVWAEHANTVGYHLILLFRKNFIEALIGASVPESIKPKDKRLQDLEEVARLLAVPPPNRATEVRRDAAFQTEMRALHGVQTRLLADVEKSLNTTQSPTLAQNATQAEIAEMKRMQDAWVPEHVRIKALVLSARGYGEFRLAQAVEENEDAFKKACDEALDKLVDAAALQPHNFIVLQNMGLIYGDPRYDPTGSHIDTARRMFTRSIELKGDDYYGHQQLALLTVRQVNASRVELVDPKLIAEGIDSAENSRKRRSGNWGVDLALASLLAAKWSQETDEAKKRGLAERIAGLLSDAVKLDGNPTRILSTDLQWQVVRLRGETDEKKFNALKEALLVALASVPASGGYPKWEAEKLSKAAADLKKPVSEIEFAKRADLRWTN